jgi:transcription elongation GreA/GreB family factor
MHRQQASDAAGALGIYIQITGNTEISNRVTVTAQSVPAGTQVPVGTTVKLEFKDTQAVD